jgi:hypothetical protein
MRSGESEEKLLFSPRKSVVPSWRHNQGNGLPRSRIILQEFSRSGTN